MRKRTHTDTEGVERTDNPILGCVEGVLFAVLVFTCAFVGAALYVMAVP